MNRPQMSKEQAEELRLYIKEAWWALAHLRRFHQLAKPDDAQPVEPYDPRQLTLFDTTKI